MEVELVQTFIPIVHTGIDKGIVSKALSWLEEYWWIVALTIVALSIWYFSSGKEQPKQEVKPIEEKPKPVVEVNLLQEPY